MLCIVATGCVHDIDDGGNGEQKPERKPASLSVTMRASDIYNAAVETRSNMADPDGDASGWSNEEKLADGRTIRRITVFLVDVINKELVAYRHVIYNGDDVADNDKPIHTPLLCEDDSPYGGNGFVNTDPTSDKYGKVDPSLKHSNTVRLTFNYDNPLHGDVERLAHGKYALIAVANYATLPLSKEDEENPSDHSAVADKNGNGFVRELHQVMHRFYGVEGTNDDWVGNTDFLRNNGRGITNFDFKQEKLYNYELNVAPQKDGSCPYIRKKLDELPLYTLAYIDLQPGENVITDPISLYRTYARVRIEVKNYSEEALSISKLSFSPNFSKDKTYFCRMPGAADIFDGLDFKPGAPVVSYGESIIAFPYYLTENHDDPDWAGPESEWETKRHYIVESDNPLDVGEGREFIEKGQTAAIFDAYISASRLDNYPNEKYNYTIELGYPGVEQYTIGSSPASSLAAGRQIAICDKDAWLYETTDGKIDFPTMSADEMRSQIEKKDWKGVWVLEANGNNRYRLRNLSSNQYLTVKRELNGWSWTYLIGLSYQQSDAETFTLTTSGSGSSFALRSTTYNSYYVTSSTTMSRTATYFSMYPYEQKPEGMSTSKTIDLQTIDSQTAAVTDVTEINRNDFLNILVEVSYNPDRGDFDFAVHSWFEGKGGDITFN